jgi:ubiquinone/menaquinone biosynthesis C-methylase UbiE
MDYDDTDIAVSYDKARAYQPGVLDMWLGRIAERLPRRGIRDIIDLGCGTGRFTGPLAKRFDANALGVDPSEKMLAQARQKQFGARVEFVNGSGEAIPAPDAAADLVFLSMSFHHLADRAKAARECRRVLRQGGYLCLRNATAEQRSPYAPFFPGFQEIADQILPSAGEIRATFEGAGFRLRSHDLVAHPMAPNWTALAEKAALRSDSILVRLPNASFAEGVVAMRAQAPSAPDEFVGMNVDLFVFVN